MIINQFSPILKYQIKKQEEQQLPKLPDLDNSLNRQKKSPAQLQINPDDDGSSNSHSSTNKKSNIFKNLWKFSLTKKPDSQK